MKTNPLISESEKAQILPIVVIALLALIAMAALILDGGSLMSNRRTAQAAADAGALAGARELCLNRGTTVSKTTAETYAINNKATFASATPVAANKTVSIDVAVVQSSFFARIFGKNQLTATATAAAGCFPPAQGEYLMPLAWSCRPPAGSSTSQDCNIQSLDWYTVLNPLITGVPGGVVVTDVKGVQRSYEVNFFTKYALPQIYIIMDDISTKVEACYPYTTFLCDLNGDGKNDIEGEGNRSWLDLDGGGGGANEVKSWIEYGPKFKVSAHTWLSSQDGGMAPAYDYMDKFRLRTVIWVPIFDVVCDKNPDAKPECKTAAHAVDPGDIVIAGSSNMYFHIVGIGAFYVTCVHEKNGDKCPGFDWAQEKNPSIKNNQKSIEGYFISGYPASGDVGTGDVDLGNYIVSLTK
ncbi:MAG: hypothetical protein C0401_09675 [Anaerolinea sp.]|nr:hypothetical protein [Anaerolinea sp.]